MWITLLIISLVIYFLMTFFILPKLLLKRNYNFKMPIDIGVKRIENSNEIILLYEPNENSKKYIVQYALIKRNDQKELVCKLASRFNEIHYDIVCHNEIGEHIELINVNDKLSDSLYTKTVQLPKNTACVSLIVTRVDNNNISNKYYINLGKKNFSLFLFIDIIFFLFVLLTVRGSAVELFGDVFYQDYMKSFESIIIFLLFAAISSLVYYKLGIAMLNKRSKK